MASERETTINWMSGEDKIEIYSSIHADIQRCKKLGFKEVRSDSLGTFFEAPKKDFRWGKKIRKALTEEQRRAASERIALRNRQWYVNKRGGDD